MFQGGPKNAQGHGQNPIQNFVNQVFFGQGATKQKMEGFYANEEGPKQMPHPEHWDKAWAETEKQFDAMHINPQPMHMNPQEMNQMFHEAWHAEQRDIIEREKIREFEARKAWEEAQVMAEKKEIQEMANQWMNAYYDPEEQGLAEEFDKAWASGEEEVRKMENKLEQDVIKDAASDMVRVMMADPDPKFQNSKFLQFLKKLETGEYKIQGNELIKGEPDQQSAPPEFKEFENAWAAENQKYEQNVMDEAWKAEEAKLTEGETKMFEDIWKGMEDQYKIEKELEEEYKKMVEQLEKANPEDYEKIFADMWQVQQDREEVELYGDIPIDYKFNENNPFANEKNPLQTTLNLANQGRTREAILALESHLQKHPNDVNSWRLLGKLHQENDQDRVAVACLLVIRAIRSILRILILSWPWESPALIFLMKFKL